MFEEFEIKLASLDDMKDVFDLSNDDLVRKNSFNQQKIEWEDHQKWFKSKIKEKNHTFFIIRDKNNRLISQVRFDKTNDQKGDISISIASFYRGKGFGSRILKSVSKKILSEQNIKTITAYIKIDNIASKITFEKAGYIVKEEGPKKLRYEYYAE